MYFEEHTKRKIGACFAYDIGEIITTQLETLRGVTMKYLLVICAFLFSVCAFASGELVGGLTYVDDVNQVYAPTLGIHASTALLGLGVDGYVGGGLIPQVDPNANSTFARASLELTESFMVDWKVSVGGGVESAKQVYRQFDDYLHVTVSKTLW
jgi:hypothetical protein